MIGFKALVLKQSCQVELIFIIILLQITKSLIVFFFFFFSPENFSLRCQGNQHPNFISALKPDLIIGTSEEEFFLSLYFEKLRNKKIAHLIRFLWLVVKNEVDAKQPFTTIVSVCLGSCLLGNDSWESRRCCEIRMESFPFDPGIKCILRIAIEINWGFWVRIKQLIT